MWFYKVCRVIVRSAMTFLFRTEVIDPHHVPAEGPVILCSNHRSYFDPPLVACYLNRQVKFMAKAELFSIPGFSWLIRTLGAFPVKRGEMSMEAMRTAIRVLKEGFVLVVFPEGTRRKNGELGEGKKGAASLALRSGAKIVPVAMIGDYKPFRRMKIVYGKPIDAAAVADLAPAERGEALTARIMKDIRDLIVRHS